MDIQAGDRIIKAGRSLIVVAPCQDPGRAWVVNRLDYGLVNGRAWLIDLDGYRPLP
jgi:hypothetical protein